MGKPGYTPASKNNPFYDYLFLFMSFQQPFLLEPWGHMEIKKKQ